MSFGALPKRAKTGHRGKKKKIGLPKGNMEKNCGKVDGNMQPHMKHHHKTYSSGALLWRHYMLPVSERASEPAGGRAKE